jgi:hypothetical protein
MLKNRIVPLLSLIILSGFAIVPPTTAGRKTGAPKFSSVYTDLNKQCKNAFKEVGEGQDMPLRCKGYGGYEISIGYSAASSHLSVEPKGGEAVVSVMPQPLNHYDDKKAEWRLADGKPFAIIIRVTNYKMTDGMNMDTYSEKNKTGESLVVKGLKGYEHIDGSVDAGTQGANDKARRLADEQYGK